MKNMFLTSVFIITMLSCSNNENAVTATIEVRHNSKLLKQKGSIISKQNTFVVNSTKKLIISEKMWDIDLIYEQVWHKEKPMSKVDSLIEKLLNWKMSDSLTIANDVAKLAETQTSKAYCFLFISCCQFYVVKHTTPFQGCIAFLRQYGSPYIALNKYYLNNSISTNLSDDEFINQVITMCYKKLPECYYNEQ